MEKSLRFGAALEPPVAWRRVLLPRAAGAAAAARALGAELDAVYDVTIAYETPDGQRPSRLSPSAAPFGTKHNDPSHSRGAARALRELERRRRRLLLGRDAVPISERQLADGHVRARRLPLGRATPRPATRLGDSTFGF